MAHLLGLMLAQHSLQKARDFRDRAEPLDSVDDQQLVARYRLPRQCIIDLCDELTDKLARPTCRTNALPVNIFYKTCFEHFSKVVLFLIKVVQSV